MRMQRPTSGGLGKSLGGGGICAVMWRKRKLYL